MATDEERVIFPCATRIDNKIEQQLNEAWAYCKVIGGMKGGV